MQIHLAQNRNDLALKEVSAARRWAQDNLLVNLAEAWVGVRLVSNTPSPLPHQHPSSLPRRKVVLTKTPQGGEKYQQSFYVFEELAQAPATSSVRSLVAQAVAEMHLGRLEEAESALEEALKAEPENADAVANALVLSVISGNDYLKIVEYVTSAFLLVLVGIALLARVVQLDDMPPMGANSIRRKLKEVDSSHAFLTDLEEKSGLFDKAAQKFSPKVSA